MKRAILSIGLALFVTMSVNVNGQEAQPKKHVKKVYIDSKGGLYIPDKRPIYLRMAFSPEESAPSILLRNKASKSTGTPKSFRFEGPGEHTIVHSTEHYLAKVKGAPVPPDIFFVNVQIGCRRGSGRPPCLELCRIGDGRRGILTEIGNEKKPGVGEVTLGQASGIAESGYIGMNVKVPEISSGILCRLGDFKRDILRAVGRKIGGQG